MDRPSNLPKEEVLNMMGGKKRFIEYHNILKFDLDKEDDWFIED